GMRLSTVGAKGDRHLRDLHAVETRLDDHLRRELHARTALMETLLHVLGESPKAAVDVMDGCFEPATGEVRKHGIAPPAVKERHRVWHHPTSARRQTAPLYELVALAKLFDEPWDLEEIIAVVSVPHDDVAAAGSRDTGHEGVAVPLRRHAYDSGPLADGDVLRAVGAT